MSNDFKNLKNLLTEFRDQRQKAYEEHLAQYGFNHIGAIKVENVRIHLVNSEPTVTTEIPGAFVFFSVDPVHNTHILQIWDSTRDPGFSSEISTIVKHVQFKELGSGRIRFSGVLQSPCAGDYCSEDCFVELVFN